jgi:DNA adenine methylase
MRPPFAYYGGKVCLAHRIIELMPPHRVYIEPFFGCGAVLFAKPPVAIEIINDLDAGITSFFRCLRERPEDLERACRLTPYARDEWKAAVDEAGLDDLERARRFWVRVCQSFSHTQGHRTGWSVTTARTQSVGDSVQSQIGRFHACSRRLSTVAIENCDAAELVARMATAETLVYADPPYMGTSRRGGNGIRHSDYLHDMPTEVAHRRIAEVLRSTAAAVILSGYPSPLYDELYGDWWRLDIPVLVHGSNAVTPTRGKRTEVLWSNRDLDAGLLRLVPSDVRGQHQAALMSAPSHD